MHTIKFAAQQTGLSQHTIRAWERRYGALTPDRTATNRRLYSNEDIDKLKLIQRGVQAGHTVGRIAGLSASELAELLGPAGRSEPPRAAEVHDPSAAPDWAPYLAECVGSVASLDGAGLENALNRAAIMLGAVALIENIMLPLMEELGENWAAGDVGPAHEHLATAVLRTFLGRTLATFQPPLQAPRVIVTTPQGQIHELGALIAAVTAAAAGWRALYLGPNLPYGEIVAAAHQSGAAAIALSIVYPHDDPGLNHELKALRTQVGPEMLIMAGGRAAANYREALDAIGAVTIRDIRGLRLKLDALQPT